MWRAAFYFSWHENSLLFLIFNINIRKIQTKRKYDRSTLLYLAERIVHCWFRFNLKRLNKRGKREKNWMQLRALNREGYFFVPSYKEKKCTLKKLYNNTEQKHSCPIVRAPTIYLYKISIQIKLVWEFFFLFFSFSLLFVIRN